MAIPRGYVRGSGGFLQPRGSRPSGPTDNTPYWGPIGTGDDATPGMTSADFGRSPKQKALDQKILASYERAGEKHKEIMAGITKSENDTFKRLNDALTASREVDAKNKDKLGNAMPPSAQTKYLQSQLVNHMASTGRKNAQAATPGSAGITPEQVEGLKKGGGPGGGRFDEGGSDYIPGIPGTRDLLNRNPRGQGMSLEPGDATTEVPLPGGKSLQMPPQEPEVFPMNTPATTSRGDKVTLKGQQRMGPKGPEYLVVTPEGKEAWIPRTSFQVAEAPEQGRGLANLMRSYEKPVGDFQPF